MSFCDEPTPVEIGSDGLALSDWNQIFSLVQAHARAMEQRAKKHPSISARQVAANTEAMRLRVWKTWRERNGYA